jgi:Ca2+-binding RTX toxin-like protein
VGTAVRPTRRGIRSIILVTIALLAAAGAQSASAAVTCDLTANTLAVTMDGGVSTVARSGNDIVVSDSTPKVCTGGSPTVTNTDTINMTDSSAGNTRFRIDLSGGPFAPGVTDEAGPSDEIEINVFMGPGSQDELDVLGTPANDFWRAGKTSAANGINLNPASESGLVAGQDADVVYHDAEFLFTVPQAGSDRVLADGGPEFDGPITTPATEFDGEDGDDQISGGDGNDIVLDGPGNDRVSGGAGNDRLFPPAGDTGDDDFDGGAGVDRISSGLVTGAIRIDLRLTGRQDTGGEGNDLVSNVEEVIATSQDDVVVGDDGDNALSGADGDDLLIGLGGADALAGDAGVDTASYAIVPAGAIQGVNVDLGVGASQNTGGAGIDTLTGVENLVGSPFADMLRGDGAANTFSIRDGVGDGVACADGADTVIADVEGTDTIAPDCESKQFDLRPDTVIDSGPPGLSRRRTPAFSFHTTKAGSTLQCSLDSAAFGDCSSPLTLGRVSDGVHRFSVRSRDMLGALDLSPAVRAFTVDATRPVVTRAKVARRGRKRVAVRYRLSEAASVRITIQRCTRHAKTGRRCARFRTVQTLRRKGRKGANAHSLKSRPGLFRATLVATDKAGNKSKPRTLRFTGSTRRAPRPR